MKGLKNNPSLRKMNKAYEVLQSRQSPCLSCRTLSLYAQWSRLDPRLGELVVQYISWYWRELNPIELNGCLRKEVWPAVFGVVLEHVYFYYEQKKKKKELALFRKWSECVLHDIQPAKGELFFIHLYRPSSQLMHEEALYSLKIYKR